MDLVMQWQALNERQSSNRMELVDTAYDIIGDVHGQADALVALLGQMGYRERDGAWRHSDRRAIFVGDFVDRGPKQVETVTMVRRMVDAGSALAVMGNHDFNAIAWYLPDPANPGDCLRPHFSKEAGKRNRRQHARFLGEVEAHPSLHKEIIDWLLSLPLWLDLPEVRIVHACWHSRFMEYLTPRLLPGALLSAELMQDATREPASEDEENSPEPTIFKAVEMLLKGMEITLPGGRSFIDKSGLPRLRARVRWWASGPVTYRRAILVEDRLREELPDIPIPRLLPTCPVAEKPTFIGHYSLAGSPRLLLPQIACVDFGAGHHGPLCAYRWDGETTLTARHFCLVQT
jgi:hypothetical protein